MVDCMYILYYSISQTTKQNKPIKGPKPPLWITWLETLTLHWSEYYNIVKFCLCTLIIEVSIHDLMFNRLVRGD